VFGEHIDAGPGRNGGEIERREGKRAVPLKRENLQGPCTSDSNDLTRCDSEQAPPT
jgi:hypothetical protein